ncbi:MAG: amidohydrolase family protein [Cyclobacteriaceae bacterium]|nr:amidohydrolase family protein [Cyclobacteriaceae bacterium]
MSRFYRTPRQWLLVLFCWITLSALAQEEVKLAPVTRTYAITNVNIIQGPSRKVDMGTVIIRNGVIQNVGKNLAIPADAVVIKADSMYVYAGFIDGYSRAGVVKPKDEPNRERPKDPGNPEPAQAGITPQNDVRTSLNPAEKSVEDLRALGFTTAQVVPYGGMLPGSAAIVQLGGSAANDMVLLGNSSFYSELTSAQRVYPSTVIGVMSKYRELYRQASQAKTYESLYASNRAGLERPVNDKILEAFYPVIDKRVPVLFKAERILDVNRVITLQKELGFNVVLGDVKEGWDMINKIKAANARVFLSLDLPDAVKEEKKDDKKEESKKPADAEKESLEKRKAEAIAQYTAQASVFQKAGVTFGFSTASAKTKDIPANLRRMIAAGLTEDQALAALTTTPAQMLGIGDRVGTVDNGKIANLVITDKSYFNEKSKVRYVFVDGVLYKYDVKEEKKADPKSGNAKKADPNGKWSYTTETPQGNSTGVIKIKNDGGSYSGTITSSMSGQETELNSIVVEGNSLTFSFGFNAGGGTMNIEVSLTIDGSDFEGTMSVGSFGSFPMRGSKEPNK